MIRITKIIISVFLLSVLICIPVFSAKLIDFWISKPNIEVIGFKISQNTYTGYYETLLDLAENAFQENEKIADSAPKQTVAVLWALKDIQSIIVMQNNEIIKNNDESVNQLLKINELLLKKVSRILKLTELLKLFFFI